VLLLGGQVGAGSCCKLGNQGACCGCCGNSLTRQYLLLLLLLSLQGH
jgi:hypothetical protein